MVSKGPEARQPNSVLAELVEANCSWFPSGYSVQLSVVVVSTAAVPDSLYRHAGESRETRLVIGPVIGQVITGCLES